ncbi:hypothetical protein BH11MYX4_BH11MYX4_56050 [soil metagenome]
MRRFLFSFGVAGITATTTIAAVSSCSSAGSLDRSTVPDDASRRDGSFVEAPDGGSIDAAPPGPEPECATYCDSVLESCKGSQAQYASRGECLAFCTRLPLGKPGESQGNSVACRQFYAGSPARTDSAAFCGAAGPFGGGGICGERCPIFCELAIGACSSPPPGPDASAPPYGSYPDCQTTCLGFAYKDGGVDGGGEVATGPTSGDTLNCRLYYLRAAVTQGESCENLAAQSPACK